MGLSILSRDYFIVSVSFYTIPCARVRIRDYLIYMAFLRTILLALVYVFFVACSHNSGGTTAEEDVDTLYMPQYAVGFVVTGDSLHRTITVKSPWQGADNVVSKLLILPNGGEAPTGFDGQVLKGYARRIVCMSSTYVAMLDRLEATSRICGVSGIGFINTPDVVARKSKIPDVGFDGSIDYENILAANPDIVLLYGVNGQAQMAAKLAEMHIPYLYIGDYLEEHPLGKAEWIYVIGEITGLRAQAILSLQSTVERYNTLRNMVSAEIKHSPTVMVNAPYGDSWTVPPSNSYVATLIADAGGRYVFENIVGNTSPAIDIEEAYIKTMNADIWLNAGNFMTMDALKRQLPKFADTTPVRNKRVYTNNKRLSPAGGNDYYESGSVNPDVVLRDMISILHPELLDTTYTTVYYRHLK